MLRFICSLSFVFLAACAGRQTPAVTDACAPPFPAAFPDGRLEHELVVMSGADTASIAMFTGTHTGALDLGGASVPATSKRVRVPVVCAGGRVVVDVPLVLAQLGANPGPARVIPANGAYAERAAVVGRGGESEATMARAHRRVYELFSQKDRAMFDLMADDVVEANPSEAHDIVGKAALVEFNEAFWRGFPDIHVDIERTFAAGDYSVLVGRLRGTNTGPMPAMGIDNTGKSIDVPFVEVVRWRDGKAERSWPFMNSMDVAAQLGLLGAS